jgi:hypothetical protein
VAKSKLVNAIEAGFSATMLTPSNMRDDVKMKEAAQIAFQLLPLPIRLGFQATVGQDGLDRLIFKLRDAMLSEQVLDVSKMATGKILEIAHSVLPQKLVTLLTPGVKGDEPETALQSNGALLIGSTPSHAIAADENSAQVVRQIAAAISHQR